MQSRFQSAKLVSLTFAMACLLFSGQAFASVDHSDKITGPIKTGPEATKQCLECHEDAAMEVMKTAHWTWSLEQEVDGKKVKRGKMNVLNNFCTSISANQSFCTKCHIGYGWSDNSFDFTDPTKIDCLVCHDTTGNYAKKGNGAGFPADKLNLEMIAKNVGVPNRDNCGQCHFKGGGGDGVKHGDLDSSLSYPGKNLDVHMDVEGNDFACQECHQTESHLVSGNSLGVSPGGKSHFGCEQCHEEPHAESRLNKHAETVACQTCHIPVFAKEIPTKLEWDWSQAGQDLPGEHLDQYGKHTYVKKKGAMVYGKNVVPEYYWFNGEAGAHTMGEKMDASKVTKLAYPMGGKGDGKIFPFKVHRGKQIYDTKNNVLITAQVAGKEGYWKKFDWKKAAQRGMDANPVMKEKGITFSGEYGFAPTEMYWRINHMVAPKGEALGCLDCHGDQGRMPWEALGYKADPMN